MKRGELYWARLEPRSGSEQQGRRPVIVVSNDGFNETPSWRTVIIIPVTTSSRQGSRGASSVPISAVGTGLAVDSFAVCHQITTLDRSKLEGRIGVLSGELMRQVERGIATACDLP